jgi:hypothetical protein
MSLKEKLRLTPDQFEQFDSLEPFQIEFLSNLHPAEQELIGELWRASDEVRETNWRGTPDDRWKALRDLRIVQWKKAILDGLNPHPPRQKLDAESIEKFKQGLMEDGVSFKFFAHDGGICEWTPDPR